MNRIAILFMLISSVGFSQETITSKKGEPYLPQAKDYSVGFNAAPVLDYLGNALNSSGNSSPKGFDNQSITVKYMKDAKIAYRGFVRLNTKTTKTITYTPDYSSVSAFTNGDQLEDETSVSQNNIVIGGGLEKRKGNTRLQGMYGAFAWISFGGGSLTKTSYSNTVENYYTITSATSLGFTEVRSGNTSGVGIAGFIGIEYFIIPKIAIGAEYTWGVNYTTTGESSYTDVNWDSTTNTEVTTTTATGSKQSSFEMDNDIINGVEVNINFYF